jgi:hypothetical protein
MIRAKISYMWGSKEFCGIFVCPSLPQIYSGENLYVCEQCGKGLSCLSQV